MAWYDNIGSGLSSLGTSLSDGLGFTGNDSWFDSKGLSGQVFGNMFDGSNLNASVGTPGGNVGTTYASLGTKDSLAKNATDGLGDVNWLDAGMKYGLPAYGKKEESDAIKKAAELRAQTAASAEAWAKEKDARSRGKLSMGNQAFSGGFGS